MADDLTGRRRRDGEREVRDRVREAGRQGMRERGKKGGTT